MSGEFLLFVILAYLIASIPFGKVISSFYGVDIQKHGSGNIGFANVRRTLGWKRSIPVLVLDILKGFLPVYVAKSHLSDSQTMVVALAALAGSIFSVWFKFSGGKGVASALGISLALEPVIGLIAMLAYLVGVAIFKQSAPSSLLAVWSMPLTSLTFSSNYFGLFIVIAVVITWTHRTNIQKLLESRV